MKEMKEMKEISTKPAAGNKSAKPTCSYYVGNIAFGISGISTRLATEGKISEADFALTLK